MEIIEKQVEKVKEVPADNYGYNYGRRDINGKANAGLTTPEGKELLQRQLKIVRSLKSKIIQDTNREMEMFRKFREFSKAHPEVTYDEFIKANM